MRANTSRPVLSVPNQCVIDGGSYILFSLLVIPIFKFNFFSPNTKNFKLIKKNNLIWYLNNND